MAISSKWSDVWRAAERKQPGKSISFPEALCDNQTRAARQMGRKTVAQRRAGVNAGSAQRQSLHRM
jgi:hypothetical protein